MGSSINQAKPMEQFIFNGTGWEYFINRKRSKIQGDDKGGKGKSEE